MINFVLNTHHPKNMRRHTLLAIALLVMLSIVIYLPNFFDILRERSKPLESPDWPSSTARNIN